MIGGGVTAGYGAGSKVTNAVVKFDPDAPEFEEFTILSPMILGRKYPACATFKSRKHGNREVVFVGGGNSQKANDAAFEVEILVKTNSNSAVSLVVNVQLDVCQL